MSVYLDWAATAPMDPLVADCLRETALGVMGNPSSIHRYGEAAKAVLEESRHICAGILGCESSRLFFTSGGSESNNIVLTSFLRRARPGHIITSAVEHSAVYEPCRVLEKFGWRVSRVGPGREGRIGAEQIAAALTPDTVLVSVMLVNNETGMIQPVREIAAAVRAFERGAAGGGSAGGGSGCGGRAIHIHTDAVQAAGKIPVSLKDLGVDSISLSAHKFRGPRGAGILAFSAAGGGLEPLYVGGGQEKGMRPGTENVAGIAAMTRALQLAQENIEKNYAHAQKLMTILFQSMGGCGHCRILPECRLPHPGWYSPYIVSLAFPPVPGEVLVRVLNDRGYAVSTGSACSARKKKDTRVIEGTGVSKKTAFSSIRVSIGPATTEEEIRAFSRDLMEEVTILFRTAS
ncbi:MAG: cysteine desulfurase [Spirochaetales bacterium]|jgi:cysteine desulfurase|nr:cysteine desulfurase [Spirochaetales bacterium]